MYSIVAATLKLEKLTGIITTPNISHTFADAERLIKKKTGLKGN